MKYLIVFILIISALGIGFYYGIQSPLRKTVTTEISVIAEEKRCEEAGGTFQFYTRPAFPCGYWVTDCEIPDYTYNMVCELPRHEQEYLFEHKI